VTPYEEIPFNAPLQVWLDAGLMKLLRGCEPPIPEGLRAWEALEEGFVEFTSAGLDLLEERLAVLGIDLGLTRKGEA
jgi:hypothetical protein